MMTSRSMDYQRRETIYEDSHTILYQGVKEPEQTPVLIKCLKAEYPTLEDIARLKHEYKILQSLTISGVVRSQALTDSHQTLALILEDFGGEPLSNVMAKRVGQRALPLKQFLAIAIQLADTLAQLHQNRIIHKNLKPASLLFNSISGQVKIADFSIASHLSRENQPASNPNLLEGTLAYLSPEQTGRMNRSLDYRTDFYSLGIVFYELLTGQLPFETADPMELVHCHLAKAPKSPQKQNPEIPQSVCAIVMKLLAKTAEDRYQNALGLKADLETCSKMLAATGEVADFQIGQLDLYSQFSIPQKLYGREGEVQLLIDAFARAACPQDSRVAGLSDQQGGATELMLVSGYSGIGKSSLVYEIHKPIVRQRGYFIAGKFDQFQRNIPYAAFIQAFQDLMRQLLTESTDQVARWRSQLEAALSPNGQVIIDVIPEVERIIGTQPTVPQLGATESQNRFNRVFQQFIHVFCQPEHPLVLFLDDLQWADSASLNLIQLLMNDLNSQSLLLIGAYRDNEVSRTHPLLLALEEIQKAGAIVNNIVLQPLQLADVNQLIADTLRSTVDRSRSLAELIFGKTQGNPFFLTQLLKSLYQDQFLWFDFDQGNWQWDIDVLQEIDITDNVVELMISQIQKQSIATQTILKLAACLGDKFTLKVLSIVNEKSLSDTAVELWESLQVGLVLPLTQSYKIPLVLDPATILLDENQAPLKVRYKFLHDRVQQAAYALIPEEQKKQTHLKIGQLLLAHTPETEREEHLFEIVNQLNMGAELLVDQSEKDHLAQLNLIAGRKAKESTAYEPAVRYLTTGLELLSQTSWQTNYELSLDLYVEATDAEFRNTNFERALALSDVVLQQGRSILEKVKVYEIQIQYYISQNKLKEAIALNLEVLEILGIPLSQALPSALVNQDESLTIEDLSSLPPMTDPHKLAAMRILVVAGPPTYFADARLFTSVVFTMVNLCIQYGNSAMAAYAYACYGLVLAGQLDELDAGYQSCRLALRLLDQYHAKDLKAEIYEIFNGHVRHFKDPLNAVLEPMLEGVQSGLEVGKIQYASYLSAFYSSALFYSGENLETVAQKLDQRLELLNALKTQVCIDYAKIWRQMVANLVGHSTEKLTLTSQHFQEEEMLATLTEAGNQAALASLHLAKANLLYLYKEYTQAIAQAEIAEHYIGSVMGTINVSVHSFYYMLALLGHYPQATDAEQSRALQIIELRQQQMEKLAQAAPVNFLHKYELVEAEKARVLGQNDRAMEFYDRAIRSAKTSGFIQEEALAAELTAEFYLQRGRERVAKDYLTESYTAYLRWGATAKVDDLRDRYPQVFSPRTQRTVTLEDQSVRYTVELGATSFDLATVMRSTQAISDEIVLDKLLDKLMTRLIENAGARTGLLLLQQSDPSEQGEANSWRLVAEGYVDRENLIVLPGQPLETRLDLPTTLINYVIRSRSPLVLNDALHEGQFTNDPYVVHEQPKSVLCMPIVYQSKLKGILYLENPLTKGAFTQAHLEVLNLLSAQAAISLENANLYRTLQTYSQQLESKNQSLEAEIQERRRVEQEREQLLVNEQAARTEAEEANRLKDEFLAVLSHELRTPLSPILGWVKFLRTGRLDRAASDRALETIERNAELQTKLIEDLLDISRILQGKLSLEVHPVDLATTITAAIETVRLAARAKSIDLQTDLAPSVGKVLGDSARLQQIIWNLVSNAIKFTPANERVTVHLEQDGTEAQIKVSDTGQGISPDFLPFVFDVFRQADSAMTRRFGGLGLGLAIVRRLVELHGGTVAVDSPGEGQGTTFRVCIPLIPTTLSHPEDKLTFSTALDLEGIKILVVDDEADMREFVVFLLEQYGAQVAVASSAAEALAMIAQIMPDVLLSDIGMPDMNGYMLMQQVKSQFLDRNQSHSHGNAGLSAIALTAYAGELNQQQSLAAGFQMHLSKPVEPEALVKAILSLRVAKDV